MELCIMRNLLGGLDFPTFTPNKLLWEYKDIVGKLCLISIKLISTLINLCMHLLTKKLMFIKSYFYLIKLDDFITSKQDISVTYK